MAKSGLNHRMFVVRKLAVGRDVECDLSHLPQAQACGQLPSLPPVAQITEFAVRGA
jgi:hypothetical protein